jgi:hypothetical protein
MTEGERRIEGALRERLDALEHDLREGHDRIERAYARFVKVASLILVLLAIVTGASGALSVYLLGENQERISDVQHERYSTIFRSCRDSALRHERTIDRLDRLVRQIKNPARRARAEQNRAGTVALISALAPKVENCNAYARSRVRSP